MDITLEKIDQWLETKNDDDIAGYCVNSTGCLVANYITDNYPEYKHVSVTRENIALSKNKPICYGDNFNFICEEMIKTKDEIYNLITLFDRPWHRVNYTKTTVKDAKKLVKDLLAIKTEHIVMEQEFKVETKVTESKTSDKNNKEMVIK